MFKCESISRGLLHDCEIFAKVRCELWVARTSGLVRYEARYDSADHGAVEADPIQRVRTGVGRRIKAHGLEQEGVPVAHLVRGWVGDGRRRRRRRERG